MATVRGATSRDLEVLLPLLEAFQIYERIPFDAPAARRGLGQWLLAEAERAARAAGIQALHLLVAPHNQRAHHIYHRAGFHVSPRLFLTKLLTE